MIRVNLLKTDIKGGDKKAAAAAAAPIEAKPEKAKKSNTINLVFGLLVVVLGALAFLQKKSLDTEQLLLSDAQEQQRVLSPVLQKLEMVELQKTFLESKIGLIEELRGKQSLPLRILDIVSASLPEWVWLMEANLKGLILDIKGRALSNLQISEYSTALQRTGLFTEVTITSSNQTTIGRNIVQEFLIQAKLVPPAVPAKGPAPK